MWRLLSSGLDLEHSGEDSWGIGINATSTGEWQGKSSSVAKSSAHRTLQNSGLALRKQSLFSIDRYDNNDIHK